MTKLTHIWPEAIVKVAKSDGAIEFRDGEVPYAILKREANPKLPGFAGCWEVGEEKYFFISEDVPERFRVSILLHEMQEFIVHKKVPGSCLKSLLYEFAFVPGDLYKEYVRYRRNFFRRLVPFCVNSSQYSEQHIRNVQESLDYLEGIVAPEG